MNTFFLCFCFPFFSSSKLIFPQQPNRAQEKPNNQWIKKKKISFESTPETKNQKQREMAKKEKQKGNKNMFGKTDSVKL